MPRGRRFSRPVSYQLELILHIKKISIIKLLLKTLNFRRFFIELKNNMPPHRDHNHEKQPIGGLGYPQVSTGKVGSVFIDHGPD